MSYYNDGYKDSNQSQQPLQNYQDHTPNQFDHSPSQFDHPPSRFADDRAYPFNEPVVQRKPTSKLVGNPQRTHFPP